jgi:2,4-dienoyl-CoA reductase-like NADH-dependent reductase (Old Yellow Enzyme family)
MFLDLFDGADPGLRLAADLAELRHRFVAGEFDLVGVGRMQIANPDFVAKLASGRVDGVRLYRKAVDLGHLFGRLEPGLIEEGRKITAD